MFTPLLIAFAASGLRPTDLRCEYLDNPIGLGETAPRLSWIDESGKRNSKQSSYQIVVAASPELLKQGKALWDSGKVSSAQSTFVDYAGAPLKSGQRVWWTVTVWDDQQSAPVTSKPAFWEMGIVDNNDWKAQWIGMPDASVRDGDRRPAPYLRNEFQVHGGVTQARIHVTAKGLYNLYVDGKRIGADDLTPGWTDYNKRVQYQTYDLTPMLKPGSHALGMVLGDGWYCGHVGWTKGDNYGPKQLALAQIDLTYKDGTTEHVVTDGSWKVKAGPVLSDDLLMGETYDARQELGDWSKPNYHCQGWMDAQVAGPAGDTLVAQADPTVQKLAELKPIKRTQPSVGAYVFDLGQNMVGWARLRVSGAAGQTVRLRFAEMLNPDGTIYTTNLRGAKATDYYTLSGKGTEVFEPSFTFHGFRYVEVTGYPGEPDMDAVTGIVEGSNNTQTGWFSCSNELVNKLEHNIYWGERGNYVSVPTDCPQRDERLGWMGDAEIFAPTACYNNNVAAFLTKWTQDVVDAQSAAGGFSDVSPRVGDPSDGAPAWGDAGVIVPWSVYQAYGDRRLLERRYPAMQKWIEYISSVNPDHLWIKNSNNNFGDWLNVQDDTPREVIGTAYFARSTQILADTARVLGKTEDATHYDQLEDEIKSAFNQNFVDSDTKIKGDTQTDYVLALRFNLLPANAREAAAKRLVDHIKDRKNHLSTGFVGVGALNPTLTAVGATDTAYTLLTNDTYPSWGYSIRQGATTIWERWDGWTQEKGFEDPGMNSFNHYSLGSVGDWMFQSVAGIALDPETPGYSHFIMHPIPGGGMTWVKATYDSIHGKIASSWKLTGGHFVWDVTIPANTTATVYIPAESIDQVKEGSGPAEEADGVKYEMKSGDSVILTVGSGTYHFVVDKS